MSTFENAYRIFRGRQKLLNGFEDGTFPIKKKLTQRIKHSLDLARITMMSECKRLKILIPKQML